MGVRRESDLLNTLRYGSLRNGGSRRNKTVRLMGRTKLVSRVGEGLGVERQARLNGSNGLGTEKRLSRTKCG